MKLNEKYFLNSLLSVSPRCALLPSVVGAYNTAYAVRGSARPSPIFLLPLVAKTSHTLERCTQYRAKELKLKDINCYKIKSPRRECPPSVAGMKK